MKRIILLTLLAVGLPTAALADSITNSGGTLSGSSAGLTLSGSILTAVGSITGDLCTLTFETGGLAAGNLQQGATFAGGGAFTITGNGTNGVPNGPNLYWHLLRADYLDADYPDQWHAQTR